MLKTTDYRRHADECRRLAAQPGSVNIRSQLLNMAKAWDELAAERVRQLEKSGKGQ
jgi:hypothetical protein